MTRCGFNLVCAAVVSAVAAGSDAATQAVAAPTAASAGQSRQQPQDPVRAEISSAEKLIFTDEHLRGVPPQTELEYTSAHGGSLNVQGDERTRALHGDVVRVFVPSAANAQGGAKIIDQGGNVELPTDGLPCNPIVLYFLERDIAQMERLTGGQRRYFQKRVRLALADGPPITTITQEIGGKKMAARQIVIQPYINDPDGERFPRFLAKRYTFVFADSVPGKVVMLRTEVPGEHGDFAHPLQTESLTFQAALRASPGKAVNGPHATR
jgi:hypothetical protein